MPPSAASSRASSKAIAVILGGGRGVRLWPLTRYRAKPAVPIAGKYRLIDIPISNCINSGFNRIYVLTQFNSSSLNHHLAGTYHMGQFSSGFVAMEAASQSAESDEWYQGTADAVRRNIKTILQWRCPYTIILPGDTIFRMDLSLLLKAHIHQHANITMALHPCSERRASSFGIVKINDHSRVTRLIEKPPIERLKEVQYAPEEMERWNLETNRPYLASMGIYIFNTDALIEWLSDCSLNDFASDILPMAVENSNVGSYIYNGYWEDVGTISSLYHANLELSLPAPPFQFYHPDMPIYTRMRQLPGTRIHRATITHSQFADGCIIGESTINRSMIGLRSVIGNGVRMQDTVMFGADYYEDQERGGPFMDITIPKGAPPTGVGNGSVIMGAIIDKNARIGRNVQIINHASHIRYDDPYERYFIRDGILVIPKHSVIEDDTII